MTTTAIPATSDKVLENSGFQGYHWLPLFFLFSWLHLLWLTRGLLAQGVSASATMGFNTLFNTTAWLFYGALYLLPVVAVALAGRLVRRENSRFFAVAAVLTSVVIALLIVADRMVYSLYAFHLNGFVFNLVVTPGGISSLGSSDATYLSIAVISVRLVILQSLFLVLSTKLARGQLASRLRLRQFAVIVLALFLTQGLVYGAADIGNDGPVLDSARNYLLFQRITFRSLAGKLGIEPAKRNGLYADVDPGRLNYPRQPVRFARLADRPNIVWLVAESLRWDQLNPKVMPNSWAFAQRVQRFSHHYSSGNGTREALFGMFYGLYGSYWENFLHAQESPLLMDRIQKLGYQLDIRTSARFTYPEFDRTIFAGIPAEQLHEANGDLIPWERDRENTDKLISFIENNADRGPFFSFFFLESTHAGYSFPESSAVLTPYAEQMDYANLSIEQLRAQRQSLLNRYGNAAHWVDTQLGRIFRALESHGLLDNTIIIVTGDHGEEFLEHGAWGHNSSFVNEQTRVPLLVAMPGKSASLIDRPTSHLDIATTLLQQLGATTPTAEYSLGRNLFDDSPRPFITFSDWHSIAVMTEDMKRRIPYINRGIGRWPATDPKDHPLDRSRETELTTANRQSILEAIANCTLFSTTPGGNIL